MKQWLAISFLLFCVTCGIAQNVQFSASVSTNNVAVGERFKLAFTLNTSGSRFTAPDLSAFSIYSGPNQSSNMKWINGKMSSSISYSYILAAPKAGAYKINSAKIKVGNKIYQTNTIQLKVVKGSQNQQQQQHYGYQQHQYNQQRVKPDPPSSDVSRDVFIKLITDRSKAYKGQQIIATYKLYFRVNIIDFDINKLPAPTGFWSHEVELPSNVRPKVESINGTTYKTVVFKKLILFPQRTGKLLIDPLEMELVIRIKDNKPPRSIFDMFGTYKDVKYVAKSNSKTIMVQELPASGQPEDFNDAVGKFTLKTSIDKKEVGANEAINLKVTLSGNGNIKLLESPDISFPSDFEVYDPKVVDNISVNSSGVSGKRTFEYLVIPRTAGTFNIGHVSFSYFNPASNNYNTLISDNFIVKVAKGADNADATTFSSMSKEDVQMIGKDIRFIKTGAVQLREKGRMFFGTPLFYTLLGAPIGMFLLFLLGRKRYLKYSSDTVALKSKKANRLARKRLSSAERFMSNSDQKSFYEEIFRALYGYLSDKLNIPLSELSKDNIVNVLAERNVSNPTIDSLVQTLDRCEMARFAPINEVPQRNVYDQAVNIISRIEQEQR